MIRLFTIALLISLSAVAHGQIAHETSDHANGNILSGNDLTVTMTSAASDGEVMIALCHRDSAGTTLTATTASGWTAISAISSSTTSSRDRVVDVFYKVASSEGTSYTFTNNGSLTEEMHCTVQVYSGVDSSVFDVTPTASHFTFSDNDPDPDPPSITTVTNNAWVVAMGTASGVQASRSCAAPSTYSRRYGTTDPRDNAFLCVGDKEISTAGAENPGVMTVTNGASTDDTWEASIALKPASSSDGVLFFMRP